jgi:hypothetical protein
MEWPWGKIKVIIYRPTGGWNAFTDGFEKRSSNYYYGVQLFELAYINDSMNFE